MKVAIDSYCYHRYFGEVYDNQQSPAKTMNYEDFLRRAIELKVDGVSLETCFFESADESYLKRLKDIIDQGGLECVVAWGHPTGLEGGGKPSALDDMKKHFRTCDILGAKVMRIVGSCLDFRDQPRQPQIDALSEMLKDPAKMAGDCGVKLAMENHFDFTADEMLEILSNVSSDYLGVTYDTGNALRVDDEPVAAARKLIKYIYATHIKDVAPLYGGNPKDWFYLASVPVGKGIIDIPSVVKVLDQAGYDGLLAIEIDYLDPKFIDEDPSVAESVNYLQQLS